MTRLSSKKPPRNIRRLDHDAKGDHGWIVTLQRKGAVIVKRFSDGIYGGKREALKAAVEYRDSFLARDKPFDHQIWIRTRVRKNNKSGIPGVLRYEMPRSSDAQNPRVYWIATWTNEHGATRQRKFSIDRYGEEEAKLLAIAERDYQLRRVCAKNAAAPEVVPPGQARIWKKSRVKEDPEGTGEGKTRKRKAGNGRGGDERVQIVEATIDKRGRVKLLESVKLTSARRALVTILAEDRDHARPEETIS
jgi:hypothetical protein